MNHWGVSGCRERFDEITAHLVGKRPAGIPEWVARIQARKWLRTAIEEADRYQAARGIGD